MTTFGLDAHSHRVEKVRYISSNQSLHSWLRELYARRDTLRTLLWKDAKVQYGSWWLGMLWSVFQPMVYLIAAMVFLHLGGKNVSHDNVPVALFLFSGIIIWNFLTAGVNGTANVMRTNANLITKAAFPRVYLIIAPVIRTASDFLLAFVLLMVATLLMDGPLAPLAVINILPVVVMMSMTTLAIAMTAAVSVLRQRHLGHAIPVLLYALLFVLPVFHQSESRGNGFTSYIYMMNPPAVSIRLMREMLGVGTVPVIDICIAMLCALALLTVAIVLFRKTERTLSDML